MNENIDLTKILKDCPKGWKLYSTIFGEVKFNKIEERHKYPIIFITIYGTKCETTAEGKHQLQFDGECTLFPSQDQRDWSKFSAPWYKKDKLVEPKFKVGDKIVNILKKYMEAPGTQGIISEITDDKYIFTDGSYISISNQDSWELVSDKFDPNTLRPFDKVLVKDFDETSYWTCNLFSHYNKNKGFYYCSSVPFDVCIPYNEETKHLVGTKDEAPEYYRLEGRYDTKRKRFTFKRPLYKATL